MWLAAKAISESLPSGAVVHHAAGSALRNWNGWTECARRAAISLELVRQADADEDDEGDGIPVDLPPDLGEEQDEEGQLLTRRARAEPDTEPPFGCEHCAEMFASRRALGQHVRWTHRSLAR